MPIYEYRCENGHTFEVMQRIADDPVSSCTTCEAPVQRVFHPVAVHFKGSGFYNTDYGTRKRAREKEGAEGGSSDSKGQDGGASDAKSGEGKPSTSTTSSANGAGSGSKASESSSGSAGSTGSAKRD